MDTSAVQWREFDGTLIDLVTGSQVARCDCGRYVPAHLSVRYGRGLTLGLVTRDSLGRYVELQCRISASLSDSTT